MSNRLTFSLASLILILAFAAMPAMAEPTVSATWTADVNGDGTADDAGWNATLTYAAAPATTVTLPATTPVGGAATGYFTGNDPTDTVTAGDATATAFKFNVTPTDAGADVTVTFAAGRRVTFKNARDLASTSIAQPKLKSITAPEAANKFFEVVITFEAPAARDAGPPVVPEIGPSDGLAQADLTLSGGAVLGFTANSDGTYTVVMNPTGTPVTVAIATTFPHQAAAQAADATSSTTYDTVAPARDATTNLLTDGPDTIPVNNRKPPQPDSGQWGPGNFDFIFTIIDTADGTPGGTAGSGVRSSSISLEDNQDPNVLSFSNIGRTGTANQFAATVSTNNVNIEAGTIVTVLATVSDMAGNEATFPVGDVTLAAKSMTGAVATFTSATPASGMVGQGDEIALVFGTDPGVVTVVPNAVSISPTGTERKLTIPANQTLGSLEIKLTWQGTGTQTLTYTVTEAQPTVDVTVPPQSYVIVARSMTAPGLDGVSLPPNESTVAGSANPTITAWTGMPDLEDLLFRGGTIALIIKKAADTALFDHDADAATDGRQYAARDLIITEVMAALNDAKPGTADELAHQWIEIYNPNKSAITGTLTTKRGRPALGAASDEVLLDRLSNVVGGGWTFTGLGVNGFDDDTVDSNMDPVPGRPNSDFVSFHRTERGKDGHTKDNWKTSSDLYFSGYKGTPGDSERAAVATVGTTELTVGNLIFNEISNRSNADKAYEWIELRNKGTGEINPKNRRISIITAVGSDQPFFVFPDNDNAKIAGGQTLLLVASDPSGDADHPLAAGWNVAKNAANQVNGVNADSPRYLVANFAGDGLPDDGEFVLILRNRNHADDVGKPSNIVDIAGYSTKLKVSADNAGFTNLWPLTGGVRSAELSNNKLAVGEVHRRQKPDIWGTSSTNYGRDDGNHHEDTAWINVGYTGIGYKRSAAVGNANGGTPGYDNGASKSADAAALEPVIISEIMFDTSRRLPQWIEIMNMSTTVGVNLTNWAIDVQNHSEKADGTDFNDAPLSTRIKFWEHDSPDGSFQLPPRQTMLIVSTGTRNDTTLLPAGRILNLRKGIGPKLLNPNGFYLQLVAKANEGDANKHQKGDKAGNLEDDPAKLNSRRTDAKSFAPVAWELPSGENEDGDRVSIARRTAKAIIDRSGTLEANWIRSDHDDYTLLNNTRPATHYGTASDIGSPGHFYGGVLPVSLSKFRPERMKDTGQVVIRWVTESELDNAGFNILRSDTRDGEFTKLNTSLIAGQGTTSERNAYEFVDTTAKPNVVYYYQIQDVSLDGEVQTLRTTHLRGNVTPAGKATTTWGDIKALQ